MCMIELSTQHQYTKCLSNTSEGYAKLKRWLKQHGKWIEVRFLRTVKMVLSPEVLDKRGRLKRRPLFFIRCILRLFVILLS